MSAHQSISCQAYAPEDLLVPLNEAEQQHAPATFFVVGSTDMLRHGLASRLWARGWLRPRDSPAHVEANQTRFCPPRAVALLREPAALLGKVVGERVRDRFDYIFLDTAPNLTLPIVAAYNATDYLLLSAILEPLAMESIRRFLQGPFWSDKTLCRSREKSPKYC